MGDYRINKPVGINANSICKGWIWDFYLVDFEDNRPEFETKLRLYQHKVERLSHNKNLRLRS